MCNYTLITGGYSTLKVLFTFVVKTREIYEVRYNLNVAFDLK